jgi:hypothetical protein
MGLRGREELTEAVLEGGSMGPRNDRRRPALSRSSWRMRKRRLARLLRPHGGQWLEEGPCSVDDLNAQGAVVGSA